ncbi:hypothetical protein AC791_17625 [Klebsiella sp. RIT-PI-d]|nr:hypothetical protein AC791_17625 [Klebsiella sp. RIT-PI-d]
MARGITNSAGDSSRVLVTFITGLLVTLREFLKKYYFGVQDGRKVTQKPPIRPLVIGMAQRLTVMTLTTSIG